MTAHTPDALASALPAGISYDAAVNVRWDTARVARFQAERLAETGYVLVHTAPDEATVERLARVIRDSWGEPAPWDDLDNSLRETHRNEIRAILLALADTPAQARHTADDVAGGT